ncbi:hypothetical protein Y027_5683 [Burkholderia pseudomallei TSV5]|uniref:Uncharacterized protein n=1 Tax=Burkholderia pseudomallei 1710a TaxID=320371 RepID=A0A0E1W1J9_BURPE|nr:hypothetical protein GBP346_A2481 [Burkholderia pseudomallei MSHR346]EET07085.1 hypothetical protein BURPS1710A_2913 [Burkholderia pseudomallei 1710a]KGX49582.1 hypothetical protein Y027_5683 [Burkholderia pseudomallei TSV5]
MARFALEMAAAALIFGRGGPHPRRPPGSAFKRYLSEPVV